jgi:hypothetical protein
MKYSYSALALIVLSGIVSSQFPPIPEIPRCAKKCVADAVAASTTCGPDDLSCQCQDSNFGAIVNASTVCVEKSCTDPKGPTPQRIYSLLPCGFSADMVEEVEGDAQYKCFLVISGAGPHRSSSVSETASSTVSPTWKSSTTGSTRDTIIVSYSGVPSLDCECDEQEKAISSPTVANNSTYTPSPTPLKSAGGSSHFVINSGTVLAIGMVVLIAL